MPGPTVRLNLPSRNTTARSYCAAMRRLKMTNRMNRMTATIRMVVANGLPMAGLLWNAPPVAGEVEDGRPASTARGAWVACAGPH